MSRLLERLNAWEKIGQGEEEGGPPAGAPPPPPPPGGPPPPAKPGPPPPRPSQQRPQVAQEEEEEEELEEEEEEEEDEGNASEKEPLVKQKESSKKSKSPRWSRGDVYTAVVVIVSIIAVSFLALTLASSIMNYIAYKRITTIVPSDADPLDDTDTQYTAAFMLSGILTPVALLFAGMVFAYPFVRMVNRTRLIGDVGGSEVFVFTFMILFEIFWLAWPGFWSAYSSLDNKAQELHSSYDDEVDWPNEDEIPYLEAHFTSPLRNYVFGSTLYMFFASIAVWLLFLGMWAYQVREKRRSDDIMFEAEGTVAYTSGGKILRGFFIAIGVMMILLILYYMAVVIFTVFVHMGTADDQIYWVLYRSSVHMGLAFFFMGWLLYMMLSNGWWFSTSEPGTGEFGWSVATSIITFVVGCLAVGFAAEMLALVYQDCYKDIESALMGGMGDTIEGDSEIKVLVCTLEWTEKENHVMTRRAYYALVYLVLILTSLALILTTVSFFFTCRPKYSRTKEEKERLLRSNVVYAKDSGSDIGFEGDDSNYYDDAVRKRSNFFASHSHILNQQ